MQPNVAEIKANVEKYQNILRKREELNEDFASWIELNPSLNREVEKARKFYEETKSEEAKKALDGWLEEQEQIVAIINEFAAKFAVLNNELKTFDEETIKAQTEYLGLVVEYEKINNAMKEIEKKTKKLSGGGVYQDQLGSNCVKLENAEGRSKWIHEYFVEDYKRLCDEKKKLAKERKNMHHLVIDKVPEEEIKEEIVYINPPKPKVVYDEHYPETLSAEEKIKELEARMERIKNAKGPKVRKKFHGEYIFLPERYANQFSTCDYEIRKLKEEIEKRNKKDYKFDFNKLKEQEEQENLAFLDNLKKNNIIIDEAYDKDIQSAIDMVNEHHEEVARKEQQEKTKPKGFMKIISVKKPKFLSKIKETVKKHANTIAIGIMTLSVVASMAIALATNANKSYSANFSSSIVSSVTEEDINDKDIIETEKIETEKQENVLKLGDEITFASDARIYNTVKDCTNDFNPESPKFKSDMVRTVGGIGINFDGQIKFFYASNPDAQSNVDMLLANGGKITAVLAQNQNGYEGFYNIKDVHSLNQNLGGIKR